MLLVMRLTHVSSCMARIQIFTFTKSPKRGNDASQQATALQQRRRSLLWAHG